MCRLLHSSPGGDCRIYTPEDPTSNCRMLQVCISRETKCLDTCMSCSYFSTYPKSERVSLSFLSPVQDTIFDEFFVGHILGWYGKAIALRDRRLLWAYSIAFELMELTFQHWLKNFNECWWDSWILDVALCNSVGIYFGMKTVTFFEGRTYDWTGMERSNGLSGKVRRSIMLFTPASFDSYIWNPTSSPLRFFQCAFVVALCLVFELNAFFLKYVLWIPPPHLLNHVRLALWFGIANISTREYYVFITSRYSPV
jgi:phosphatidylserine synthase 2